LVLASAEAGSGCEESGKALAELCRTYWRPVFAYVGRSGYNATDAQDLTQGFFLKILKGDLLQRADPERGRFRTLLLHALKNFLLDGHAKETAKKRGGGVEFISWDDVSEEYADRSAANPQALDGCPADRLFDIRWAATVVEQAQWRLGEECERNGRRRLFDCVRGSLAAEGRGVSYATLATQLGVPEITVKRLLHRLRQRYRELLREEVAQTVTKPEEIDDELRYLCSALAVEIEA
jgi:RNA polymerase sigma-70 factor (ECF subfamily)